MIIVENVDNYQVGYSILCGTSSITKNFFSNTLRMWLLLPKKWLDKQTDMFVFFFLGILQKVEKFVPQPRLKHDFHQSDIKTNFRWSKINILNSKFMPKDLKLVSYNASIWILKSDTLDKVPNTLILSMKTVLFKCVWVRFQNQEITHEKFYLGANNSLLLFYSVNWCKKSRKP